MLFQINLSAQPKGTENTCPWNCSHDTRDMHFMRVAWLITRDRDDDGHWLYNEPWTGQALISYWTSTRQHRLVTATLACVADANYRQFTGKISVCNAGYRAPQEVCKYKRNCNAGYLAPQEVCKYKRNIKIFLKVPGSSAANAKKRVRVSKTVIWCLRRVIFSLEHIQHFDWLRY